MKKASLILLALLAASVSHSFEPTMTEVMAYKQKSKLIHQTAAECLDVIWQEHVAFHKRWGVSKFYGDRNKSLDTPAERREALARAGAPTSLESELEPTSCIGLTRRCLAEGFRATEDRLLVEMWARLDQHVRANGVSGVVLINGLQKLGWKILYWNPDPSQNAAWDAEDPRNLPGKPVTWNSGVKNSQGQYIYNPGWGMHAMRFRDVMKSGVYYQNRIDDRSTLVNFKTQVPETFKQAPLFVGVAHSGYHVFPGFLGTVIEAHSTRPLDSIDNLERSMFNPLAPRGGPRWSRTEKYRSGVIAIPPTN